MLAVFVLFFAGSDVFADELVEIARIKTASASATVIRNFQKLVATPNLKLAEGDVLRTGPDGTLSIIMRDNGLVSIGPNTSFTLQKYDFEVSDKKIGFIGRLAKGTMVYTSGLIAKLDHKAVKIQTPNAICGVRGTTIGISVEGDANE
jgi:hypothetical protein